MPTISIDHDTMKFLESKAVEFGMVFNKPGEVFKEILRRQGALGTLDSVTNADHAINGELPSSRNEEVQRLITALFSITPELQELEWKLSKNGKWIANPNFVAIKVQDARKQDLAVDVYGIRLDPQYALAYYLR